MNPRHLVVLLLAGFAVAGFAQECPVTTEVATYPNPPLTYPMTSNRYAVQYQLGGNGTWTNAQVYISYYGGTTSTPFLNFSGYTKDTSMSFVSIPANASTGVAIRVTKIFGTNFPPIAQMSVRPKAKGIQISSVNATTVQLSTNTAADFSGDQFVLWWDSDAKENSGVQGLALFLNPPYNKPTGTNVKTIAAATDLSGDLSGFDTLDFEGTVAVASTGAQAFVVPVSINNIFLGPSAWLQGKLRFMQSGAGHTRKIYGPGVLDVSRFSYANRLCKAASDHPDDGYESISWIPLPGKINGVASIADGFIVDGVIVSDSNFYATAWFNHTTINNMKIIGWNGNNDGIQMGMMVGVSNVFVHTGDDSLKMWGSYITVTNATVWQTWNGGVINLGWSDNSPGDACLIDGVYVVKTDWSLSNVPTWASTGLNFDNSAIVASLMIPGTKYGATIPSLFRNIYVEDPPRVLFSLKILPPACALCQAANPNAPPVDLTKPSVLNLNIDNVFTPASKLGNSIGFQTVNGTPLTGSMAIGLSNVMITSPDGTQTPLSSVNAPSIGKLSTNGDHVSVQFGPPTITLVANAFGDTPTIGPNMWVEIKGSNLAPVGDSRIWQSRDFVNNQMPKQLDGVSVTVNGKDAYIWFVSPAQVNILTPPDPINGPVNIVLTNIGAPSAPFSVQTQMLAPAFFVFDGVHVTGVHLNGGDIGPTSLYPGLTTPAKPSETIVLFANGFGPTATPVVSGAPAQSGSLTPLPVVKIGGVTATVQFAGLVAPGEFQFNVVVPASTGDGDQPIVATYNGLSTQLGVVLAVQH
jgi:uncharacterized protein (TIGR03437 family)